MRLGRNVSRSHTAPLLFAHDAGFALLSLGLAMLPITAHAAVANISAAAFAGELSAAHARVLACEQSAQNCDSQAVPGRQTVQGTAAGSFQVDWQWLADALAAAKANAATSRLNGLLEAEAHLEVLSQEAGIPAPASEATDLQRAHQAAQAVLARGEFQTAAGPGWLERKLARLQDALLRLFVGMDRLGHKAPWLAPLLEWGCFLVAAAGLLWSVRQSLSRQALRIALTEGAALRTEHTRAVAWVRLAEEQAAAGAWREAIHNLYWAGIALLEGRRAWKPNSSRTPREYLRLLRPGSEAQTALQSLTRGLERAWYGAASLEQSDYLAALASFQVLETARPERATGSEALPGNTVLLAAGRA